jgi:UDP-N-acetylmuramoyl-tripeptide--D-alanyl-D-alanine ligase
VHYDDEVMSDVPALVRGYTPQSLATAASGRLLRAGSREIVAVFIDSRAPVKDALFVPIVAARDGHAFVADAIAGGASAVLIARGREAPTGDVTVIEVDDTLLALQRLGAARRALVQGPVVAVSGSNGKTTTRAMIAAVLGTAHPQLLCTRGNLNNHLGVPLTLLGEPADPTAMVIELGMSAPGENDLLARIVSPTAAVITSVALEHLEFMKTIEAIAAAEAEPIAHVRDGGIVVVPSDEPLLRPHLPAGDRVRVWRVGPDRDADVRLVEVSQGITTRARLSTAVHGEFAIELQLFGLHNARNAAAAIAVGTSLGLPLQDMTDALARVEPVGDRGRTIAWGEHVVVADCYNANPGSVAAALRSLAALGDGRRRVAVLGDMLELGPDELALHAAVGEAVADAHVDALVAFGPRSREAARAAASRGVEVLETEDVDAAAAWIRARVGAPTAVLVKGSRGMKLERVVEALVGVRS